ncbi:MAG: RecX family transcriptional regulator [Anaeroplasmataceae bacterium]|nr:RecX family transcriptional regulator [Anaeroplasmataceae bacterium]
MIVQSLTKTQHGYEVMIDDKPYILDEDVILKYRLFEGTIIKENALEEILRDNAYEDFKKKALAYHMKYMKSSKEVQNYLVNKGITNFMAKQIITDLKNCKLLDDFHLAKGIACSLARNSNGPKMIEYKLKHHLFENDIIVRAIEEIEQVDYNLGKEKLYKKGLQKYNTLDDFSKKQKIKNLFYQHGYPNIDIS